MGPATSEPYETQGRAPEPPAPWVLLAGGPGDLGAASCVPSSVPSSTQSVLPSAGILALPMHLPVGATCMSLWSGASPGLTFLPQGQSLSWRTGVGTGPYDNSPSPQHCHKPELYPETGMF